MKRVALYLVSVPADILASAIVLFVWALWGDQLQVRHGVLCCQLKEQSWPSRTWYAGWGATTFGHAIMYAFGHIDWEPIWHHELVHVEQFESNCLTGFWLFMVLAILRHPYLGLVVWTLGPTLAVGAAYATAWLRGEDIYKGSHLEEAARAVATCKNRNLPV